jgi:diguanylate cyclase (GGDEF)-like protein
MHPLRPGGSALLSLLYAVGAALCAVGALVPVSDRSPVALLWALAGLGAAVSVALWLSRERSEPWVLHAAVLLASAALGLLTWRAATSVGIVGLGPAMVSVGVFSGHFFSRRAARVHVGLMLVLTTVGALAAAPTGFLPLWLTAVATVVVLTEVQSRISGDVYRAAATDPLTGLANRRAWQAAADRGLAYAHRSDEPFTVVLIDLDDFKTVNDQAGHRAGDALLSDLLGRYGGDEFVLSLPGTDAARTEDLLTRLRAAHPAAWSAGTATARPGDTLADLLVRADGDLYRDKRRKRGS